MLEQREGGHAVWGLDSADSRTSAPLPSSRYTVPDWFEQAGRRKAFEDANPDATLLAVGGNAMATVPLPGPNGGERTIRCETWREVLDELGAPADPGPG